MASFSGASPLFEDIGIERRLAAVLAADVAGLGCLTDPIANTAGDSVPAEFPGAVNAFQCVAVQQALRDAAKGVSEDRCAFAVGASTKVAAIAGQSAADRPALSLKPSTAVLPFQNMSDPEPDNCALGLLVDSLFNGKNALLRRKEDMDHRLAGLRRAGLPE